VKLSLINPNTSRKTTRTMVGIASETAGVGVTVTGHTANFGAALITGPEALATAAEAVAVLAASLGDADAVIVAAFGDPGLDAVRAALGIPVTGIAEAGMAEASEGGRRFAVVTTTPDLRERIAETARRHGHQQFAGTWTTHADPVELTADPQALVTALAETVERAIREGAAEAVIIGGGPLAVAARALSGTMSVPLIEPLPAAVRLSLDRVKIRSGA